MDEKRLIELAEEVYERAIGAFWDGVNSHVYETGLGEKDRDRIFELVAKQLKKEA